MPEFIPYQTGMWVCHCDSADVAHVYTPHPVEGFPDWKPCDPKYVGPKKPNVMSLSPGIGFPASGIKDVS